MANAQVLYAQVLGLNVTATGPTYGTGPSIAAGSFSANNDYLILAWENAYVGNASQFVLHRLQQGGSTVTDGLTLNEGNAASANSQNHMGLMRRITQGASPGAVTWDGGPNSTADYTGDLYLMALKLADLGTENTDWYWNEVTADYTTTASAVAQASVTFTPNGTDDWLIIGNVSFAPGSISSNQAHELYDSVVGTVMQTDEEGEASGEIRASLFGWVYTPSNASHTVSMRAFHETTAGTVYSSQVFAVNLSRFAQHAFATRAGNGTPATTPSWTTDLTVAPTPSATGDWVVLAWELYFPGNITATNGINTRLQVDASGGGLASNPAYGDNAPGNCAQDASDQLPHMLGTLVSLSSGASRTINFDAQNKTATGTLTGPGALVAFSVALGGVTNHVKTAADSLTTVSEAPVRSATAWARTTAETLSSLADAVIRTKGMPRSVADALASVSETAARAIAAKVRTTADALASVSEVPVRAAIARARTTADALGTLGEAVVRVLGKPRTAADALSTISETPVRLNSAARTLADALATISEAPVRLTVAGRIAADALASVSEVPVRAAIARARTTADALTSLAEAVVGVKSGATAWVQTAADALSTISEAAARSTTAWARTGADTLSSVSETAVRISARARTAADTLGSVTESVARAAAAKVRTAADSLSSITEGPVRLAQRARTTADALGSLSETVGRAAGSYARTATDTLTSIAEAVVGVKSGATAWVQTASDALASVSESVIRAAGDRTRSVADTLSSLSEVPTRFSTRTRSAADALTSVSEVAVRVSVRLRTASDALVSVSEIVLGFIGGVAIRFRSSLTRAGSAGGVRPGGVGGSVSQDGVSGKIEDE